VDRAHHVAEAAHEVIGSTHEDKANRIAEAAAEEVQSADELQAEIAIKDVTQVHVEDEAEDDSKDDEEDTPRLALVTPRASQDEDTLALASESEALDQMLQGTTPRETLLSRGFQVVAPASKDAVKWPEDMKQGPPKHADDKSRDEFVRKCTIVTTVSHKRMLPSSAVEAICRSTDQVVQCKMDLGNRMQLLHERGRSMTTFCSEAWDWFLDKYGQKCPNQCRKMQCRSTCAWLEANEDLKREGADINERLSKVSGHERAELTKVLKEADEAQKAAVTQTRARDQQKVVSDRAAKADSEASEALNAQTKRAAEMAKKLKQLEEDKLRYKAEVRADIKIFSEWKRKYEKQSVQATLSANRVKELKEKIEPLTFKIEQQMDYLKHQKLVLEDMQKGLLNTKKTVDETEKQMKEFGPKMKKAQEDMKKAEVATNEAYEEGEDMNTLQVLDQYLADAQANYFGYQEQMAALENTHRNAKDDYTWGKKEMDNFAKEVKKEVAADKELRTVRAKIKVELLKLEEKSKRFSLQAMKDQKEVAKLQRLVYQKEEKLAEVETSIRIVGPTNQEEQEKLAKCQKDLEVAAAALSESKEALLKGEAQLNKLKAAEKKTTKVAQERRKKFKLQSGGLDELVAAHKARRRDLNSRMPEIVFKHKLHKQ